MRTKCAHFLLQLTNFFPALHIQPPCELDRQRSGFYPFLKVALCDPARVKAVLLFNFSEVDEVCSSHPLLPLVCPEDGIHRAFSPVTVNTVE